MVGEFIREVRLSRGLTQSELGQIVGMDQPNISAYERGHRVPSADALVRIAAACGYEVHAVAGSRRIYCPLESRDPGLGDDPHSPGPAITPETPMARRVEALTAVLNLADELRRR